MFEPFTQANASVQSKFGGTGLGLVISRRLARALGGDVAIAKSIVDKGTTFEVTVATGSVVGIPHIDRLDEKPEDKVAEALPRSADETALHGMDILLVEDAPENRLLISHVLKHAGAKVDLAENGVEGVTKAMRHTYDLILMDVQMPKLNGYEAASRLRHEGYKEPIVALTAQVMTGETARCLAAGYDDCLSKPIERSALISEVALYAKKLKARGAVDRGLH